MYSCDFKQKSALVERIVRKIFKSKQSLSMKPILIPEKTVEIRKKCVILKIEQIERV